MSECVSSVEVSALCDALRGDRAFTGGADVRVGALGRGGVVDLHRVALGDEGLRSLCGALRGDSRVTALLLGGAGVTAEGVESLAEELPTMPSLRCLHLGANAVGVRGAEALAGALRSCAGLRSLWLKRAGMGDAGVRAVVDAAGGLRTLDLAGNGVSRRGWSVLSRLPSSIEALRVGANEVAAEALPDLASLRVLSVTAGALGDEGLRALGGWVERHPGLHVVELDGNALTPLGVAAFAEVVAVHPGLRRLSLGGAVEVERLRRRPNDVGRAGALGLTEALAHNTSLRAMDLVGCMVSDDDAMELVEAAERHPRMARVSLGGRRPDAVRARLSALACRVAVSRGGAVEGYERDASDLRGARRRERAETERYADDDLWAVHVPSRGARPRGELGDLGLTADEGRVAAKVLRALAANGAVRGPDIDALRGLAARVGRAVAGGEVSPRAAPSKGASQRRCYACRTPFTVRGDDYPSLCGDCAALHRAKRDAVVDLSGRVAIVTGARVKIGHAVALRLLRAGATVHGVTRFAHDAARRFAEAPDFAEWSGRLQLHGLDLRNLPALERWSRAMADSLPRLDALINNAAQTVWRPPEWYAPLLALERADTAALPEALRSLVGLRVTESPELLALSLAAGDPPADPIAPLDPRPTNSWRMRLGEVPTREALEVHAVNALAPMVLLNALRRLMAGDGTRDSWVVNVSAVEGQFARSRKPSRHPHTSMAKAALNMLTRTAAEDWARDRIYMVAVDTGWVSNENPLPVAEAMEASGFVPPVSMEDAAARVLDPVFTGVETGKSAWGVLLKDYRPAPW